MKNFWALFLMKNVLSGRISKIHFLCVFEMRRIKFQRISIIKSLDFPWDLEICTVGKLSILDFWPNYLLSGPRNIFQFWHYCVSCFAKQYFNFGRNEFKISQKILTKIFQFWQESCLTKQMVCWVVLDQWASSDFAPISQSIAIPIEQ